MKEKLHRIFSVVMALLLLASTTSWTVEKHYCMGRLMDISLFEQVQDCGMDMDIMSNDDEHKASVSKEDSCCNNEIIAIAGQDNLKTAFNDISLDQQLFLVAFTFSYLQPFELLSERHVPDSFYPPPLLVKDIQLLDGVFLI